MSSHKRVLPVLFAHFFAGLVLSVIVTVNTTVPAALLPPLIVSYRIRTAVLAFIQYMPPLYLSGLLIGFTLSFSSYADERVQRWSGKLLAFLKSSFAIMLVVIGCHIVLTEGVAPIARARMATAVSRSEDYHEYVRMGREMLRNDEPRTAEQRVLSALDIWKDSPEAVKLLDDTRYRSAEKYGAGTDEEPDVYPDGLVLEEFSGMTVLDALDISEGAARELDFFDAHYYAMLAHRLSRPDDPLRERALRMASDAWNRIVEGTDLLRSRDDISLYAAKRAAYNALNQGDYLTAYYEFLDLHTADTAREDRKRDPDLERFLELARKGVMETFFFIDETRQLRAFESARNVVFTVKRPDGGTDAVYAAGVVYTRVSGRDVVYLRDFELIRHSRYLQLEYHIRVPFVKMFAYSREGEADRSELLLQSVDRSGERTRQGPVVIAGAPEAQDLSVLLLDLPYRDFSLIVSANRGAASMNMLELVRFHDRAEQYGYEPRIYLREVISRLSEPFILLILSVMALIAGWKYRLGNGVLFKAWWLLMVPLFTVISYLVIQIVRFYAGLCIQYFVITAPALAMLLSLVFLAVCFTGVSLYFFSQRSD